MIVTSLAKDHVFPARWLGAIGLALFAVLGCVPPALCGSNPSNGDTADAPLARDSYVEAVRFENGEGVEQDYKRAVVLYCEAANHGDVRAFMNLGWIYANGRGVPRNDTMAVGWWAKAADRGVEQAANLLGLLPNTLPASDLGCRNPVATEPLPAKLAPALRATIERIALSQGVDARLVIAVIATESAFNQRAISRKNAQGLMQLMPETAARFGVRDPFNAEQNIRGGTTYLRWLMERFQGDVNLALAAYNAGEAAVDLYGGIPPFRETVDYVKRVNRFYAGSEAAGY